MSLDFWLEVRQNGTDTRMAHGDASLPDAVAQLEAMAAGRADLLDAAAGQILGSFLSRPGSTHPRMVYAVALLVLAGADTERIAAHVDRARELSRDGYQRR